MMTNDDNKRDHSTMLRFRRINPGDECETCHGSGVVTYGSTSTWRGGIGGCAMTDGVCDVCWGSGNKCRLRANDLP